MTDLNIAKDFLHNNKGYLKKSAYKLAERLNIEFEIAKEALVEVKQYFKSNKYKKNDSLTARDTFINSFSKGILKNKINTKTPSKNQIIKEPGKTVLVIGDLHLPFTLDGYLEHCKKMYQLHHCNEVVFIGDLIDNHASSYHETDPDGMNAGKELDEAIAKIKLWYNAFPKATIIIGNHDRIIMRKAHSSGLSKRWIKDYAEVLGTPGWNFTESIEIDNVLYIHGEGGTARNRVKSDLQSIVQGHLHTQCYTEWFVGAKFKIFGMQVGCGVDHKSYAMTYAKEHKKPAIACGIVIGGKTAFNEMMEL